MNKELNNTISEAAFESEVIERLQKIGWNYLKDNFREDLSEVVDWKLLKNKIIEINNISDEIAEKAIFEIKKINDDVVNMNASMWKIYNEGIKIFDEQSKLTKTLKIISENINLNNYVVTNQFEIYFNNKKRIPDVVLFINGMPVVIMELKSPLALEGIEEAFKQNESLKRDVPEIWKYNVINFLSNRIESKYGSITSGLKRFHSISDLKTRDKDDLFEFLFSPEKIYKFITTFSYFANEKNNLVKYIAASHQIKAVENTINKLKLSNNNKGGVIWHTQGSGKSVTMLLMAKSIIENFNNSTIIMVTDRSDLDDQLFGRFLNAKEYLRNEALSVQSRKDLIEKLNNKKQFGVYFSTVQKFFEGTGILSDRKDIFILVDEAHRSQNNITGQIDINDEEKEVIMKYGYAKYMRDAFPESKFIAFTGTPLMKDDKKTIEIFGDYNHKYLMNDAVLDGQTVPIHYEMRKTSINLNEKYLAEMDDIEKKYIETLDQDDIKSQQKLDMLLKNIRLKEILENEEVINAKAKDILKHYEKRKSVLHGKSMIVANSRTAAYKYWKAIRALRPDLKDKIILVMTGNNKDSNEMAKAIVPKFEMINVASEFRKEDSKYKIAIVVDMWLTGFDVPDLDVLYIDKIIKWHNLMQAIARVNRTYEDIKNNIVKQNGLIVDYIGIWKYLANALSQYTDKGSDNKDFSIDDIQVAKTKLVEEIHIVNDYYVKNIKNYVSLDSKQRYQFIMNSYESLLELENTEKNKFVKAARNVKRFLKMSFSILEDEIVSMSKVIISLNEMITKNSIALDSKLQNAIEDIKNAVKNSIDMSSEDVFVSETKISKNINDVAEILEKEADEINKSNPRISIEMMKNAINARIQEIDKIRPIYAEMASNKLRDILNNLQKSEDIENVIKSLKELSKEIVLEQNKSLEFEDVEMQAFYEILANDEYLKNNENSEVLRRIAEDLLEQIKATEISQFETNPRVKSKIKTELMKLLRNKYNYPPEYLGASSGILIDKITKRIRLNKNYFEGN